MRRAKQDKTPEPALTRSRHETESLEIFKEAVDRRAPSLKVLNDGTDKAEVRIDHPDEALGGIVLARALGTTDLDFASGLLCQLVAASVNNGPSESGTNFMLSVVKGIEPRDQIEAMLAAQMAAVHMASMRFAQRLANVESIPQQDSAERALNKLMRTFSTQVVALKDYRSKGEQRMTVQHVHVADGGQAFVGNVNSASAGGGVHEKSRGQPHVLRYAPGETLPCDLEANRETVSSARSSGPRGLSDARGRRRSAKAQS